MTTPSLQTLLQEWQRTLRLVDWDIEVARTPRDSEGHAGNVYITFIHHAARIEIADDEEEVELTLLHELLHVRAANFDHVTGPRSEVQDEFYEQFIEGVAKALLRTKLEAQEGTLNRTIKKLKGIKNV